MSKFLIYILILLLNINNLFFQQLIKLPVLFQHYTEHQQDDEQIGILDFLSMHYFGKDIKDNDDLRDSELPFKSIKFHHTIAFTFVIPQETTALFSVPYIPIEKMSSKIKNLYSVAHLKTVFRPPLSLTA
ncbi:hypothetical protein [Flavobacterium sp.]|uniref:hypothetical protein n=1 Tax=Flavobacterium sp. TaxID=239 RepID=UPI003D0B8B2F